MSENRRKFELPLVVVDESVGRIACGIIADTTTRYISSDLSNVNISIYNDSTHGPLVCLCTSIILTPTPSVPAISPI